MEHWSQEYALLALRIDKLMRQVTEVPYVDGYYGPPEWKEIVKAEPAIEVVDLIEATTTLQNTLPTQGFELVRTHRLEKLLRAMEIVCQKLSGKTFSLEEEVQRIFDFCPQWVPETVFEEALATWDELLPGKGSLDQRWYEWREQYRPAPKHAQRFSSIAERMVTEIRRRTQQFVELPAGESIKIRAVSNRSFSAANYYLGNHQTRIEVNTDMPLNILDLLDTLCHEGYPGHHVECILKDQYVYQEHGYIEQSVPIVFSPPCLISEGIAMLACSMIFASGELEQRLYEYVYPELELISNPVIYYPDEYIYSSGRTLVKGRD